MIVARFGGASLEEVGQEFGVSRERVRQICERAGVEKGMLSDRPLFSSPAVARPQDLFRRQDEEAAVRRARKARSKDFHRAERRKWADALRALAAALGRTPTLTELAATRGYAKNDSAMATVHFATRPHGPRKTPYTERTKRLYRAAGLRETPKVGGAGHVVQKDWREERRRIVLAAKRAAAMVGGRPPLSAINILTGHRITSGYGAAIAFASDHTSKGHLRTPYRTAARRLYRAAGILRPYGWAPSLDQRHGAY